MSIDLMIVKNITVFKEFKMNFSKGINIIIGENGTGKTTLLKMIYAACEWSNEKTNKNKSKSIYNYFNYGKNSGSLLVRNHDKADILSFFTIVKGKSEIEYRLPSENIRGLDGWLENEIKSVFIPTTEMLSHSKGFLALNQKYEMPFDATQIDIIANAELPETREISKLNEKLLNCISQVINGEVVYENDTFYIVKKDGRKIEFSFEAEGLRRFGLLWKLIRNGLIEENTVLIWDEPEVSINPELIPVLVDIIIELQRNGVQIFIATHSYNLAKYFEVKKKENDNVLYHSLYHKKNSSNTNDIFKFFSNEEVIIESNEIFGDLKANPIIEADSKLLDDVIGESINE